MPPLVMQILIVVASRLPSDAQAKASRLKEYLRQNNLFAVKPEFREWRESLVQWGLIDEELKLEPDNWNLYIKDVKPIKVWDSWKTTILKYIPLVVVGSWWYLAN